MQNGAVDYILVNSVFILVINLSERLIIVWEIHLMPSSVGPLTFTMNNTIMTKGILSQAHMKADKKIHKCFLKFTINLNQSISRTPVI